MEQSACSRLHNLKKELQSLEKKKVKRVEVIEVIDTFTELYHDMEKRVWDLNSRLMKLEEK